jgi:hypothetical protein
MSDNKPILDYLTPLWVEKWRDEGLFRRTQYEKSNMRASSHKNFCKRLWLEFWFGVRKAEKFDISRPSNINPADLDYQRKEFIANIFMHVSDEKMRGIMAEMILVENPISASLTCERHRMAWEQFCIDFNYGLWQMRKGIGK